MFILNVITGNAIRREAFLRQPLITRGVTSSTLFDKGRFDNVTYTTSVTIIPTNFIDRNFGRIDVDVERIDGAKGRVTVVFHGERDNGTILTCLPSDKEETLQDSGFNVFRQMRIDESGRLPFYREILQREGSQPNAKDEEIYAAGRRALERLATLGETKDSLDKIRKKLGGDNLYQRLPYRTSKREKFKLVPVLIKLLEDEDPHVRTPAAQCLGELNDKRAVEPLIKALRDDNLYVRYFAILSLAKLKDERSVKSLAECFNDTYDTIRQNAVYAIGNIKCEESFQTLLETLKHEDIGVANSAVDVFYMRSFRDKRAIEPIIDLVIRNPSDRTIRCAGVTLKKYGNDANQAVTRRLLKIEDGKASRALTIIRNYFDCKRIIDKDGNVEDVFEW